jgi:hypothetical protein
MPLFRRSSQSRKKIRKRFPSYSTSNNCNTIVGPLTYRTKFSRIRLDKDSPLYPIALQPSVTIWSVFSFPNYKKFEKDSPPTLITALGLRSRPEQHTHRPEAWGSNSEVEKFSKKYPPSVLEQARLSDLRICRKTLSPPTEWYKNYIELAIPPTTPTNKPT